MNSLEISDFLNSKNIKTPHNKTHNHKIIWISIMKYKRKLNRFYNDKILDIKDQMFIEEF